MPDSRAGRDAPAVSDADTPRRRRPTSTSSFGVSRRESHDASDFYSRFAAPEIDDRSMPAPADVSDRAVDDIYCGDARDMTKVADDSVALVVTSPPYFAGKAYETELGEGHVPASYLEYLDMLTDVFAECVRTLEPGGRIAVNVANLGRRPYRSLAADVTAILQDRLRLLLRGEIIWQKQRGSAGSCAWGSFQRPGNPVLRDLTERVVVASKGRFDRALPAARRRDAGLPWESSLERDEFMDATLDLWELPAESATRVGHPAPFPVALPERCIHLYTYVGDLVLDPFMGSGSTAVAAVRTGRHFVGYDTDQQYVDAARERVRVEQAAVSSVSSFAVDLRSDDPPVALDDARRRGVSVRECARLVVEAAGGTEVQTDVAVGHGLNVDLEATVPSGRRVRFVVCGAYSATRTGLRRSETLLRTVGVATVSGALAPDVPVVVLAVGVPASGTALGGLLGAARASGAVAAVIDLDDADPVGALAAALAGLPTS